MAKHVLKAYRYDEVQGAIWGLECNALLELVKCSNRRISLPVNFIFQIRVYDKIVRAYKELNLE